MFGIILYRPQFPVYHLQASINKLHRLGRNLLFIRHPVLVIAIHQSMYQLDTPHRNRIFQRNPHGIRIFFQRCDAQTFIKSLRGCFIRIQVDPDFSQSSPHVFLIFFHGDTVIPHGNTLREMSLPDHLSLRVGYDNFLICRQKNIQASILYTLRVINQYLHGRIIIKFMIPEKTFLSITYI